MDNKLIFTNLPTHVAIIMDGNGRWAKEKGLPRVSGHNEGMKSLREIVRHSSDIGIKYLTVYAFSTENWKRPEDEISGIFKLLVKYVESELSELKRNNVRINLLGDISRLPEDARAAAKTAVDDTAMNTGLVFNIAINYGGRADIVYAINNILNDEAVKNKIADGSFVLSEDDISNNLYTKGMPDPDLLIRTGGEYRISNFLTWQSAYSEIVVSPVYWPDFTPEEYDKCLTEYQSRDRRFGGIKK